MNNAHPSKRFLANQIIFQDYIDRIDDFLTYEKKITDEYTKKELEEEYYPSREEDLYFFYDFDDYYQLFLYSFTISLYQFFDDSIIRYLKYEHKKHLTNLSLSDIQGRGPKKYRVYLEKVLEQNPDFWPKSGWNDFYIFNSLRNCIVHNNGYIDEQLQHIHKKRLEQHIPKNDDIDISENNRILLKKDYSNYLLDLVFNFLEALFRHAGYDY